MVVKYLKKVGSMKTGECGIVKKLNSSGDLRRRIIDMGVTPGTKIEMIKSAPFGDPLEVKIHGYDLSIRKAEADDIELFEDEAEAKIFREKSKIYDSFEFAQKSNEYKKSDTNSEIISISSFKYEENKYIPKVALIGNPNSGKTTLFNNLTGSYQYVGNWPGVTVERKEGKIKNIEEEVALIDLPGIYSLSPYSPEEVVTRDYIISEKPDVIVNIVDVTNLERNLYLTTQLLEMDVKVILALNMTDLLEKKGQKIDYKSLGAALGVSVVPISAGKGKGMDELTSKILEFLKFKNYTRKVLDIYSPSVRNAICDIDEIVNGGNKYVPDSRFNNVKIFENDSIVMNSLGLEHSQIAKIHSIADFVSKHYEKDRDMVIADERYRFIRKLCDEVTESIEKKRKYSASFILDKITTGKYTAIPFFVVMVLLIFYITFGPFGLMLKNWCEIFINSSMYSTVEKILNYVGASYWSKSLVLDALIGGVGSVISFLPQVILLFTLLSLLEDCGYMARAAFIMDKPLRKLGLSGRAFVPLMMGFGCSVPAVLGTKILENKKDKNLTIFLIPFMSCSAKMPIYLLFASAFFPKHQSLILFSLYLFGVLVAILTAYLFKDTLFKGEDSPFIMEIPEYKAPSPKNIWLNVWDKTRDFVERAGTVILMATVVVWFLQSFSFDFNLVRDNSESILATIGNYISPVFNLCGFGDWRSSVSLLTGVMAKESIVSTMSVLYGGGNIELLGSVLPQIFSVPSALAFLTFALLYTPCIAAISAMRKEFGSFKLIAIFIIYQLLIAYSFSALVYQVASLVFKFAF